MNRMKNRSGILAISVSTLLFAACGGRGGDGNVICYENEQGVVVCESVDTATGEGDAISGADLHNRGDSTGSDEYAELKAFMKALPEALCQWYAKCGHIAAEEVAECSIELAGEMAEEVDPNCPALLQFYNDNEAGLNACLDWSVVQCKADDIVGFCPLLAAFDISKCKPTIPGGDGSAGDYCTKASDCKTGMQCMPAWVGGSARFCAYPCKQLSDCDVMHNAKTNAGFALDPKFWGQNQWHSKSVFRGIICDEPGPSSNVPSTGQKYCQYICSEWAGVVLDKDGNAGACACWPNYKWANSQKNSCVFDPDVECSIFKKCIPKTTTNDKCSGELTCFVNLQLEGVCVDLKTGEQIEACVQQCTADSCDSLCLANCSGENCVDVCCDFDCD